MQAAVKTCTTCFPNKTVRINTVLSVPHITFLALCVGDLQVAVRGSELLPAHDLPLQIPQRDAWAVNNHRVVAQLGGEFIMNMSHAGVKTKNLTPVLSERTRQLTVSLQVTEHVYLWLVAR